MKELDKKYDPKEMESKLYKKWIDKKYFHAEIDKNKKPFTIVMPPPNITGKLHMGHALDNTLQDILIRTKRMQGYSTLWVPGTDHASIATEVKVVNKLLSEGIKKEDLTREKFLETAWEWKEEYDLKIVEQLKKLGISADWDRKRFTLDECLSDAVLEVFVRLYNDGLIYKGKKLINYCTKCKTTISDAEVEYEEQEGNFYHLKYFIEGTDEYLEVATTRPETLFGDTAVAVNPDDTRYKKYIGSNVILPLVGKAIPVVADEHADPEFGTGVVKITPGHDPNDYEVGLRHNLDIVNVLNDDGTMNKNAGRYEGLDRYECRKKMIEDLKEQDILIKIKPHVHSVGVHDRCHETIEPLVKEQWFVAMEKLAKPALDEYYSKNLNFVPERFGKIYTNWLENIRDWCISRQLWWGHRIPAYYCQKCGKMVVSKVKPEKCECGSIEFKQDEDVLDTWFSSALWPFSTLGWPNKTEDFEYFYPTNVLVTGYDIIFFWVIRMVFSGLYNTKKLPFKDVLFHGIVRDSQGRKMSKSLGNGVDPLDVIDKYGADALRLSLISGSSAGNDMRYYDSKVEASRNFANKIWNATRFIMMNQKGKINEPKLELVDKWILSKLDRLVKEVTQNIDNYELGIAADKIQDFIWSEYCDWYIEMCKVRLRKEGESKNTALWTLNKVLIDSLKLLHPFMPFITEEIFTTIQDEEESIMISKWPKVENYGFEKEEEIVEEIKNAVKEIRNVRATKNIAPSKKISIFFIPANENMKDIFERAKNVFEVLVNTKEFNIIDKEIDDAVKVVTIAGTFLIPLLGLIDIEEELKKLNKEKERLEKEVELVNKKLNNQNFMAKAPIDVIEGEKIKKEKYETLLNNVLIEIKKYK